MRALHYSTTPLLCYSTTPLLLYLTIPPLQCFTSLKYTAIYPLNWNHFLGRTGKFRSHCSWEWEEPGILEAISCNFARRYLTSASSNFFMYVIQQQNIFFSWMKRHSDHSSRRITPVQFWELLHTFKHFF